MNDYDILLASLDGDLLISSTGDLVIGSSTIQNQHDIIEEFQGETKQYPSCGVGILQYENGEITGLSTIIKKQLIADGLTINNLQVTLNTSSQLNINVNCSRN